MYVGSKCETRFMYINNLEYATTVDSNDGISGFPVDNLLNNNRSSFYIPKEVFNVTNDNKTFKFKVGAGADVTVTLTVGEYLPAALATHIQTIFSNNFSVEYVTASKRFRIKNTSTFTAYLSENAASWDLIGFTSGVDLSGLSNAWYLADEVRRHSDISFKFDMGSSAKCGFFALLGEKNKTFCLSDSAQINIRLSNIDDYASAPINITLAPNEWGCCSFLDALTDAENDTFRYFWLSIYDRENVTESYFVLTHLFLGEYKSFSNRTINNGFGIVYLDKSIRNESVSGSLFFNKYGRVTTLSSLQLAYLTRTQANAIRQLAFDLGTSTHLYLSLDAGNLYSDPTNLCFYGVLDSDMQISSEPPIYFNASFAFRED